MSTELQNILNDMTGVGEDKDYIIKMFEKLTEENKNYKDENKLLQEMVAEIGLIDQFKDLLINPIKQDDLYINKLIKENKKLKEQIEKTQDLTCDFCDNERCVLTKRDAGYDEWTCAECHKEQYPEEYELD